MWTSSQGTLQAMSHGLRFSAPVTLTGLSLGLLAARFVRTGSTGFAFLAWNLALAWAAYALGCAACAAWDRGSRVGAFALFGAFWLMFPNAFYLVTDLIHLRHTRGPLWHDFALLFSCAGAGTALSLSSLSALHQRAKRWVGALGGWLVVGAVALSTGYAIWLGRIVRLNSWDVLTRPARVARSALGPVLAPAEHLLAWGMTGLFATLLLTLYVVCANSGPKPERM